MLIFIKLVDCKLAQSNQKIFFDFVSTALFQQVDIIMSPNSTQLEKEKQLIMKSRLIRLKSTHFIKMNSNSKKLINQQTCVAWLDDSNQEWLSKILSNGLMGLKHPCWIFLKNPLVIKTLNVGQQIYFVNSTKDNVILSEYYQLGNKSVNTSLQFSSLEWAMHNVTNGFLQRRSNFKGTVLKAIIATQEPYVEWQQTEPISNDAIHVRVTKPWGMFVDFAIYLEQNLNMTFEYYARIDGKWGDVDKHMVRTTDR